VYFRMRTKSYSASAPRRTRQSDLVTRPPSRRSPHCQVVRVSGQRGRVGKLFELSPVERGYADLGGAAKGGEFRGFLGFAFSTRRRPSRMTSLRSDSARSAPATRLAFPAVRSGQHCVSASMYLRLTMIMARDGIVCNGESPKEVAKEADATQPNTQPLAVEPANGHSGDPRHPELATELRSHVADGPRRFICDEMSCHVSVVDPT